MLHVERVDVKTWQQLVEEGVEAGRRESGDDGDDGDDGNTGTTAPETGGVRRLQ